MGGLCVATVRAQTMVENFEYDSDDALLAAWIPSGSTSLTLTNSVAPRSTGTKSMRAQFNFPSAAWATETIRGQPLATMLSIAPTQYLTFRLRGDPAFAAADFRNLYLYAYDDNGNFGRWGTQAPITDEWQIFNFRANTIQQPWDSTVLPDLSRIVKFAFFQYGSQAAITPYTAAICIDDLMVRDTPLTEFPSPSAPRVLIDDFESYANDAALRSFYSYQNSPAATVTTASLQTPAPQGNKALKLAIDFTSGQYPWGSVRSAIVPPFSLPTNAVVSFQLKGDPALAAVADRGTSFWLSFYDKAGNVMNYVTATNPVITADWTTLQARLPDFGNTSTVDIGNLVQWRILVQGWTGTAAQAALSGAFYIDNIQITVPATARPTLSLVREGAAFKLTMDRLNPTSSYELRRSPDLSQWTAVTVINATAATATWAIPNDQPKAFFQLVLKP